MTRSRWRTPVAWALLPVLAACTIDMRVAEMVRGSRYPADDRVKGAREDALAEATANEKLLRNNYTDERARHGLRTGGDPRPPRLCVAFSGGGIRSGAFAVGVMQGLHRVQDRDKRSILGAVDVMSATSGVPARAELDGSPRPCVVIC